MNKNEYKGLGRRKSSIARVKLVPGTGKTLINNRTPEDYFPNALVIQDMQLPLTLTNNLKTFDIFVKVQGGGFTGQAGAIRLGIARALLEYDEELRKKLKLQKLLTRDARSKERKKFGHYGARVSPQFTKR
ncbi:MAG: 30S ribosomal protein S9 [Mycoplasmataceae bacterium]|nr:30S ribosomal protein S9 [Mycoplasmataceae bacterium]MBQ5543550.1 30S ribosomal protein S9 [Mycoplasmataceae bacterium]